MNVSCDTQQSLPKIGINVPMLIQGLFAAAAAMISFGGVIGKASVHQLVAMVIAETIFYSVNLHIYGDKLQALDVGGSVVIHTFGAYFGLAASKFITPKEPRDFSDNAAR